MKGKTTAKEHGFDFMRETCPICGSQVWSVALHYLSCPKLSEMREIGAARKSDKNMVAAPERKRKSGSKQYHAGERKES